MEVGFIPESHQGSCILLVDAQAGLEDQFVSGVGEDFFGAGAAEGTCLGADGSIGFDGASGLAPVVRTGYGVEAQGVVEGDLGSLVYPLVGAASGAGGGLGSSVVLGYAVGAVVGVGGLFGAQGVGDQVAVGVVGVGEGAAPGDGDAGAVALGIVGVRSGFADLLSWNLPPMNAADG